MKTSKFLLLVLSILVPMAAVAREVKLESPDKRLTAVISIQETVSVTVSDAARELFSIENISLDTDRGLIPMPGAKVRGVTRASLRSTVIPVIKEKTAQIPEIYNSVNVAMQGGCVLVFRLYNDGFAYRIRTNFSENLIIKGENALFSFDADAKMTYQQDDDPKGHGEMPYVSITMRQVDGSVVGNLPALVEVPGSKRLLLLESDVQDYPYMWLRGNNGKLGISQLAYPETYDTGHSYYSRGSVLTRRDYIAETAGKRDFPWRGVAIANNDGELMTNQLAYLLAPELRIDDPSWIKPGWVMFDWWAKYGVYGVDFEAGVNTATAKYMIDFCKDYGIRYFLFDDGWTVNNDLSKVMPELDMKEVMRYANQKGVDIMLWVPFCLIDEQMDCAMPLFEEWGVKGLKIDFMDRSDQEINRFYWRVAEMAAKHKMVLNFHGCITPDGLRRAYPNVLTREGLVEFEYNGWTDYVTPGHNCTLPFIRNVVGPQDYIPGTLFNATQNSFRQISATPMSQGTRAHSIAMAVISQSQMQMLPDAPTWYYKEGVCGKFLTAIPVEWDEVKPLQCKVGDYVSVARRSGSSWFVGAITNWDARKLMLDLDFLDEGKTYTMEVIRDGVNASTMAIDYVKETVKVRKGDRIEADMAPGGGWVAKIYK